MKEVTTLGNANHPVLLTRRHLPRSSTPSVSIYEITELFKIKLLHRIMKIFVFVFWFLVFFIEEPFWHFNAKIPLYLKLFMYFFRTEVKLKFNICSVLWIAVAKYYVTKTLETSMRKYKMIGFFVLWF
jgi:hypothetical protein